MQGMAEGMGGTALLDEKTRTRRCLGVPVWVHTKNGASRIGFGLRVTGSQRMVHEQVTSDHFAQVQLCSGKEVLAHRGPRGDQMQHSAVS